MDYAYLNRIDDILDIISGPQGFPKEKPRNPYFAQAQAARIANGGR